MWLDLVLRVNAGRPVAQFDLAYGFDEKSTSGSVNGDARDILFCFCFAFCFDLDRIGWTTPW